jgi:hypothetical protein
MARQKSRQPVSWEAVTPATGTVVPDGGTVPPNRWRVTLAFLPEMVVDAADRDEAVQAYNRMMGVTHTTNRHEVVQVTS